MSRSLTNNRSVNKARMSQNRKLNRSDMEPSILVAIILVSVATIILVSANIIGYYGTFTRPAIALLNSSGLAENYPFQIANATPVTFELQLIKPESNTAQYSLQIYLSNGTNSQAEINGPIGAGLAIIGFPSQAGNITLPMSLTLFFTLSDNQLKAYQINIDGQTHYINLTLPYGVIGFFFELAHNQGGRLQPVPYAWVSLWLNIEAPK
jgi:uncharacterized membrane protein